MKRPLIALALIVGVAAAACTPADSDPSVTDLPDVSLEPSMPVESDLLVESMSPETSPEESVTP